MKIDYTSTFIQTDELAGTLELSSRTKTKRVHMYIYIHVYGNELHIDIHTNR